MSPSPLEITEEEREILSETAALLVLMVVAKNGKMKKTHILRELPGISRKKLDRILNLLVDKRLLIEERSDWGATQQKTYSVTEDGRSFLERLAKRITVIVEGLMSVSE